MRKILLRQLYIYIILFFTSVVSFGQGNFVRVNGSKFAIGNKPYYYAGTNYWYGVLLEGVNGEEGKQRLAKELDFLKANGVSNLRVFVGAEGVATHPFRVPYAIHPEQDKTDPKYLQSLDYFLAEAGKRDMKVVLFLTNNWDWSGGITQYLQWNGYGNPPTTKGYGSPATTDGKDYWEEIQKYTTQFYNCDACIVAFDSYIKKILTHKNVINGKAYVDDPAIMAWEIANEPRPMQISNLPAFQKWIAHAAMTIKSIDKNHLVTTGSEGEIAYNNNIDAYTATHKDPNIDYLTIHIWPKNWGWFRDTSISKDFSNIINNTTAYINRHIAVAKSLNKPLVLEEFGLPRDKHLFARGSSTFWRDTYYATVFKEAAKHKDVIAGLNFWGMGGFAKNDPKGEIWKIGNDFTCDPGTEEQGLNSVFSSDISTWKVISDNARNIYQ